MLFSIKIFPIIIFILISSLQSLYMQMKHYPVMAREVLAAIAKLKLNRKFRVADCNFGLGGHSNLILTKFPNASITAFELDQRVIQIYKDSSYLHTGDQSRLTIKNKNFVTINEECLTEKFDVVLADLGYNSVQLEETYGFAWTKDSLLDMRYSPDVQSCAQLIQNLSSAELGEVLHKFGDLPFAQSKIVGSQIYNSKPVRTTFELRDCVVGCFQQDKTRKLAQVFQAFRICVNQELKHLNALCKSLAGCLNPSGLALIITFHSLERNTIHQFLKESQNFQKAKTSKPSLEQLEENSRSASARMLSFRLRK